ncbi:hypothetical protein [Actinomadura sp. CNU-125]|uniref:hypothetical protein n=1 Tax=Actinomadura sp. CNU-125 TaxID=1904961 RepID=UPI0013011D73|nr:hypothetical protein [Actinomadura sp. CNU-125]
MGHGGRAAVLAVLGGGLPLLDSALGRGGRPLAAGAVVAVGTERAGERPVRVAVPSARWCSARNGRRWPRTRRC